VFRGWPEGWLAPPSCSVPCLEAMGWVGARLPRSKKELSAWLPGNGYPHRFLRAWLSAVASGDFSCIMTLGRAAGGGIKQFFFGPGWFGASPKHGPLHHMDLAVAGHSLAGGPGSLGAA
jgi:hypothetical protein